MARISLLRLLDFVSGDKRGEEEWLMGMATAWKVAELRKTFFPACLGMIKQVRHMTMTVAIKIDGQVRECPDRVLVGSLAGEPGDLPYIAARVNNDICSLSYPLSVNSEVVFLTMSDPHGWRVYLRSLCFLLAKAAIGVCPDFSVQVEHSLGVGLYCSFHAADGSQVSITVEQLAKIEGRMMEIVEEDLPIERRKVAYMDAVRNFEEAQLSDTLNLLSHRNPPRVVIHWCDGFSDLAHGPLVPRTGVLKWFKLIHYEPGFVLHLPTRSDPTTIPEFEDQPHLFNVIQEHKEWGKIVGIQTVGQLNEVTSGDGLGELIRTIEALHEQKLSELAEQIASKLGTVKLLLIAGPSCAGKTTSAKRLTTHLRVNGLRPVVLSTDDYFVGEKDNPRDENGNPDYEHIEAVDLELFNSDLVKLVAGEEIDVPRFNFQTKQRDYRGDKFRIEEDQMVIIEGIHGLNPRLTEQVPAECEFKLYINALTQLNLDSNNRISTTDNRLMRRIVRDHRFRGHSPLRTLQMWPSVRRGEKKWIFPFQKEAHATFNSALDYELAILKPFVEPLLMQVKPCDWEYAEARRLTEFLLNFVGAFSRDVPRDSILREYIGGSTFKY